MTSKRIARTPSFDGGFTGARRRVRGRVAMVPRINDRTADLHALPATGAEAPLRRTSGIAVLAALTTLAAVVALTTTGCRSSVECTAEVTAGAGTFKGTAKGPESDVRLLRRQAVKDGCEKMCAGAQAGSSEGCAARCVVDAEAGKVGAKTKCGDER
jgi:hypothetical protein